MKPYLLAESHWKTLCKAHFDLAVLPWGATEAHNFHLPYSTDTIEADFFAAEAARMAWERGAKPVVLPTVPFGVNTGQTDILLDINLNPTTQLAILHDIVQGLDRQGIHKLLILNSHGGNDFKPLARELGLRFPTMFIAIANWYAAVDKTQYFDNQGDHADEMETSLMLYLRPELVLSRDQWGEGREKKNRVAAFREGWAWTERKWSQITTDTGVGNPFGADSKKGEKYFRAVAEKLAELIVNICQIAPADLYEDS